MHKLTGINALNALIDLKRIQHLVLLGEELHFSRAAERANLSQTAFSRSIQSLETDLNLRLFDRGTRSVGLTAAGKQVLERARELLSHAHCLRAEADFIASGEGGELSFGASQMATTQALHQVINRLRAGSPKLKLSVEINHWQSLSLQLLEERIEFFVANADMLSNDARFSITPLPAEPASIFCNRKHPLAQQKEVIRVEQFLDYSWAAVRFTDSVASHLRHLFNLPASTQLPVALNCNDLPLLRQMILNSDALLFSWHSWLADDLCSGEIVDLASRTHPALPTDKLYLSCAIVQLSGRTLSPVARQAVALILEQGRTPPKHMQQTHK
jgi:DNA-binding transcriptional LysR family regulator